MISRRVQRNHSRIDCAGVTVPATPGKEHTRDHHTKQPKSPFQGS
jgi:hypothetical protein